MHGFSSAHEVTAPGMHTLAAQLSPTVHALPSLHESVLLVMTQPATGSQPTDVQTPGAPQSLATPAWHVPPAHTSYSVQALPVEHDAKLLA